MGLGAEQAREFNPHRRSNTLPSIGKASQIARLKISAVDNGSSTTDQRVGRLLRARRGVVGLRLLETGGGTKDGEKHQHCGCGNMSESGMDLDTMHSGAAH